MKAKKIMAVLLAVSVIGSVAGCAKVKKISEEDFISACESMGAEEVDPEDDEPDSDALEDGVYMIMDHDYLEEHEDDFTSALSSSVGMYGVDVPDADAILEIDDVEEIVVFAKMDENIDDISDSEDISDLDVDAVVGMHITLTDADKVEDIMNGLSDTLDEMGVNVEDLSSDEYYVGKNEGYLRFNIAAEDLIASFVDSDTAAYLALLDADIEEYLDGMTGDIAVATYINGEDMVIVFGAAVNNTVEYLDEFCGYLKIDTPSKLDSNTTIAQAICDYIDDTIGKMLSGFSAMAQSYDY